MKIRKKRKYNPPRTHSNLTQKENLQSLYDPNGSYTGIPVDNAKIQHIPDSEVPIQDVDDL